MRVIGIDFTSAPGPRKPIVRADCSLDGDTLRVERLVELHDFEAFESALRDPGPWIAGIDMPFGQSRRFVENIGWPRDWAGYVEHAGSLTRETFRRTLDEYRAPREPGDKEHRRATDAAAGAVSPQKLYGVPVGLMFLEGVPRLLDADVTVPGLHRGDPDRVVVEAYPGVLARHLLGRRSYKNETRAKRNEVLRQARAALVERLRDGTTLASHGVRAALDDELVDRLLDEPMADGLDAVLCALQAAWAWGHRDRGFGAPADVDPLEGWIAEATLYAPQG